ncbi:ABC transporter ATP-binding protein [Limnospira platensis]|uniref:ABC transporter ATP-binding protein n=1 Tax=Limnospira platensis TaxID=118562 RepID=UPI000551E2EB
MMTSPLLQVNNLETRFITNDGVVKAVNGISYHINPGETLGIVGESGSGKSAGVLSILRLISANSGGITGGEIWFENQDLLKLNKSALRKIRGNHISMIFQDPMTCLNPVLTIGKQITEAIQLHGGATKLEAEKQAIALLEKVGISPAKRRLGSYPHQLSGGMRQRVMMAIALACHPKLLIADEPTTALDVTVQAQVIEMIQQLQNEMGMAVIWITHDLALLARFADRILVMYAGQIVEEAPVNQLYKHPRHPYTMGLLKSLPRPDCDMGETLAAIPGTPPDLINYPQGCPFAPRCQYAIDRCFQEDPVLELVATHHQVACWVKP